MIETFTNRISSDLKESKINWNVFLSFIPIAFLTFLFHELGHWTFGELLGNDMTLSLNNSAPKSGNFAQFPHLTLSIQINRVLVIVVIPHGIKRNFRKNIVSLEQDGFEELVFDITANLGRLFKTQENAKPWIHVCQRHYRSRLSLPINDARLEAGMEPIKG